jgi:hypothetical protein
MKNQYLLMLLMVSGFVSADHIADDASSQTTEAASERTRSHCSSCPSCCKQASKVDETEYAEDVETNDSTASDSMWVKAQTWMMDVKNWVIEKASQVVNFFKGLMGSSSQEESSEELSEELVASESTQSSESVEELNSNDTTSTETSLLLFEENNNSSVSEKEELSDGLTDDDEEASEDADEEFYNADSTVDA